VCIYEDFLLPLSLHGSGLDTDFYETSNLGLIFGPRSQRLSKFLRRTYHTGGDPSRDFSDFFAANPYLCIESPRSPLIEKKVPLGPNFSVKKCVVVDRKEVLGLDLFPFSIVVRKIVGLDRIASFARKDQIVGVIRPTFTLWVDMILGGRLQRNLLQTILAHTLIDLVQVLEGNLLLAVDPSPIP
jgi:hypothetical protein